MFKHTFQPIFQALYRFDFERYFALCVLLLLLVRRDDIANEVEAVEVDVAVASLAPAANFPHLCLYRCLWLEMFI